MQKLLKWLSIVGVFALLVGCATVPAVLPVNKVKFPKYGFEINEPSWNSLSCNERFMLSADESKQMKNTGKVRYDLGYGIFCNLRVTKEDIGPDVRIGWRDTRFVSSKVLTVLFGEIAFLYFNTTDYFTYQCMKVGEVLNPLLSGRSQTCRIHFAERNVTYNVAIYNFTTETLPDTESWVMITDIYNKGYATEAWLKRVVETIRPLPKE
jgi:hypothetical protein